LTAFLSCLYYSTDLKKAAGAKMIRKKSAFPLFVGLFCACLIASSCTKREAPPAPAPLSAPDQATADAPAKVPAQEQAGAPASAPKIAAPAAKASAQAPAAETDGAASAPEITAVAPASAPAQAAASAPASAPASKPAFAEAKERRAFEEAIVAGDLASARAAGAAVDVGAQDKAIEAWAKALEEARELDAAIERLSAIAEEKDAPPQVSFALAALYGRKGLIQKQYAALVQTEQAAKARPDVVFAISAVYGRKDTLKSKYRADELLIGGLMAESEPSGAKAFVDGKERGSTPLALDKLAEGRHQLRLEYAGYDAWEAPFDVDTGRETRISAKLGAQPGSIEVALSPALKVSLDHSGYEDSPHLFEGVVPGDHDLDFASLYNKRYYVASETASVAVAPGQKALFKKSFVVGRSTFGIADAPKGSGLYIDGIAASQADADAAFGGGEGLGIDSGVYEIKVVSPSGQGWYQECRLLAGARASYKVSSMIALLAKRTVKLDGKTASWGDLEPIYETESSFFMGNKANGIKRVYMCRDDKYLYWRVDFQEASPLWKVPKGTKKGIQSTINESLPKGGALDLSVFFDKTENRGHTWLGISENYNFSPIGSYDSTANDGITFKSSAAMYVARVYFANIKKYLSTPAGLKVTVANTDGTSWLEQSGTPNFYVDFTK
jgi:hypothetical protein